MFDDIYKIVLHFNVSNEPELNDLRANITVDFDRRPSTWYFYRKEITVIDKGKVLVDEFNDKFLFTNYKLEAVSKSNDYAFLDELLDNTMARVGDFTIKFNFKKDAVYIKSDVQNQIDFDLKTFNEIKMSYHKNIENKELQYFDPNKANYKITELSLEALDTLLNLNFQDLSRTDKIKEQDILKLTQLTVKERRELIKIHRLKEFEPITNDY